MTMDDWGVRPLLLVVESDAARLAKVETELARGFSASYRVRGEVSAADTVHQLEATDSRQERVALVLVDCGLAAGDRELVTSRARVLHPEARRGLLVDWGAWSDRDI